MLLIYRFFRKACFTRLQLLLEISESQELAKGERQEGGRKEMKTIGHRTLIDIKYTIYKGKKTTTTTIRKEKKKNEFYP